MPKNQIKGTATQPQCNRKLCKFDKDQYCICLLSIARVYDVFVPQPQQYNHKCYMYHKVKIADLGWHFWFLHKAPFRIWRHIHTDIVGFWQVVQHDGIVESFYLRFLQYMYLQNDCVVLIYAARYIIYLSFYFIAIIIHLYHVFIYNRPVFRFYCTR